MDYTGGGAYTSLVVTPTLVLDSSQSKPDLNQLMARISREDHDAFEELYRQTSRLIYGFVRRILNNPSVAEEVTLDVYIQVWNHAAQYNSARSAPVTWLIMLARSRSIDSLRSRRNEVLDRPLHTATYLPDASLNPEETLAADARQKIIRSALDSLQLEQRQAIELAFYSGLSHICIAEKLGQPLGTVKSRIRLGMQHLRDLLQNYGAGL
jgi:RNA polymerase sigma-70 factor, ECF subfamily